MELTDEQMVPLVIQAIIRWWEEEGAPAPALTAVQGHLPETASGVIGGI